MVQNLFSGHEAWTLGSQVKTGAELSNNCHLRICWGKHWTDLADTNVLWGSFGDGFNSHFSEKFSPILRDALDIESEWIVAAWSWTRPLLSVSVAIPDPDGGHQRVTDAVKLKESYQCMLTCATLKAVDRYQQAKGLVWDEVGEAMDKDFESRTTALGWGKAVHLCLDFFLRDPAPDKVDEDETKWKQLLPPNKTNIPAAQPQYEWMLLWNDLTPLFQRSCRSKIS